MTKFRKSLLIFFILALLVCTALGTFVVLSLTGSLKAEPIALEFTVDDATKKYDGAPLKASSCALTSGYLIEGHTPVITYTGERTDVGYGRSGLDVKIVNEDGYDVTKEYKIKVNEGILEVTYCGVEITLTTREVIYDGTKVDIGNGYSVTSGELAVGHRISVSIKDEWFESAGKIVAGQSLTYEDINLHILDSNGRNVTGNYNVALRTGKINIVKRTLCISPISAEKVYDGTPLQCSQYKIDFGSLASGHYLIPDFTTEQGAPARLTDAGNMTVKANAVICDMDGDDVTENYDLVSNYGTLTVNKANLLVTAQSASWVYDGEKHSLSEETQPLSAVGLANGDKVEVTYKGELTSVGTAVNEITSCTVDGGNDNYEITLFNGTLTVTKAPLTVTLRSLEKEYDGKPFSAEKPYEIYPERDGIELSIADGYFENIFNNVIQPCTTTYTAGEFKILKGIEVVTENFAVTVIPGNLTITRCSVTLEQTNVNLQEEYGGSFTFTDAFKLDGIADGHRLASVTLEQAQSIYDRNLKVSSLTLVDAQGNSVLNCYDIKNIASFSANVAISPKDVNISLMPCRIEYDDKETVRQELLFYVVCTDLSADKIDIKFELAIGTQEVTFTVKDDNQENYTFISGNKQFELIKKNITKTAEEPLIKDYDARPIGEDFISKENYSLTSSNILGLVDAGVYSFENVFENETECITEKGKLEICPLTLKVVAQKTDFATIYNGQPFVPDVQYFTVENSNSVEFSVKSLITANDITDVMYDVAGEIVSQKLNFRSFEIVISSTGETVKASNVSVDFSNLSVDVTINRRQLGVTIETVSGNAAGITMLDGQDLTDLINVSNLVDGDRIVYVDADGKAVENEEVVSMSVTGSEIQAFISVYRFKDNTYEDVSGNYDIPQNVTGNVIVNW